jgi:hypothetical protein
MMSLKSQVCDVWAAKKLHGNWVAAQATNVVETPGVEILKEKQN